MFLVFNSLLITTFEDKEQTNFGKFAGLKAKSENIIQF